MAGLETDQLLGSAVPPFHVTVVVQHHQAVAHGLGGFLDTVEDAAQSLLSLTLALLVAVETIEQVSPDAIAGRRLFMGIGDQPGVEALQVLEMDEQIQRKTQRQAPAQMAQQATDQAEATGKVAEAP